MDKKSSEYFEEYLTKYCECRGVSKEEALTHELVKLIKESYEKDA